MMPNRDQLAAEIRKHGRWYQRIEFPEYRLSTTDDAACVVDDPAWDNLFPGMDPSDAPRMRPVPKYERLKHLLPDLREKTVLDVGCSCGFFALEFAKAGARAVTGIDIDPANIRRAQFCASVLHLDNVSFTAADLGSYTAGHQVVWGASLHEHFFFPFYYLARMLCLAGETLLLETHQYVNDDSAALVRLDIAPTSDVLGTHAFHFSRKMYLDFLRMLQVPSSCIDQMVFYDDGVVRRLLLLVDTREFQRTRSTHPYLGCLRDVGGVGQMDQ